MSDEIICVGPNGNDYGELNSSFTTAAFDNNFFDQSLDLQVEQLDPNGKLPTKSNEDDMGWDLYCIADEDFVGDSYTLKAKSGHKFKTGIAMSVPKGYGEVVFDRSGMGSKYITKLAGVLDRSYTGEIQVILYNLSDNDITIRPGDRIAQFLILPVPQFKARWVEKLEKTNRGSGSFGSTGR